MDRWPPPVPSSSCDFGLRMVEGTVYGYEPADEWRRHLGTPGRLPRDDRGGALEHRALSRDRRPRAPAGRTREVHSPARRGARDPEDQGLMRTHTRDFDAEYDHDLQTLRTSERRHRSRGSSEGEPE